MGIFCDVISDISLGTSTAKTLLDGGRIGSGSNYVLNANARGIIDVQPYVYIVTPTANQTLIASLKVESDDLAIKDFEVLAPSGNGYCIHSFSFCVRSDEDGEVPAV